MNSRDAELHAIEELGRRSGRLSGWIAAPIVIGSVLLGLLLFFLLRDIQLVKFGAHFVALTALMAWGPVLAAGLAGARFVSRTLVRARRASWIEEVAREHQVNPRVLEEFFGDWS